MSDNCCNLQMSVDEAPRLAMQISGANYYGPYQLPTMSETVKGGAMLGSGLEIESDTLSIDLTDNATGESITAADASYFASLTVDGKAVQDGTPTPSNPVDVEVVAPINLAVLEQGSVNVSDGSNLSSNTRVRTNYIPIEPNVNYITSTNGWDIRNGVIYDKDKHFLASGEYPSISTGSFKTTNSNARYLRLIYSHSNTSETCAPSDYWYQFEKGASTTPYTPYGSIGLKVGSTITSINLNGNVLASLPDGTKDVLTIDSMGHCVLEKRVGRAVYSGASGESWTQLQSDKQYIHIDNAANGTNGDGKCTHAVLNPATNAVGQYSISGGNFIINTGMTSVANFLPLITSNNLSVVYKLATPQTIDLGYIDMPAIPDGSTISITAQVTPTITAAWWARGAAAIGEALKAVHARLQAIEAAIAELATA